MSKLIKHNVFGPLRIF